MVVDIFCLPPHSATVLLLKNYATEISYTNFSHEVTLAFCYAILNLSYS